MDSDKYGHVVSAGYTVVVSKSLHNVALGIGGCVPVASIQTGDDSLPWISASLCRFSM